MNQHTALPVRAKANNNKQPQTSAVDSNWPSPKTHHFKGKKAAPKTSDVMLETKGDEIHLSFGGLRRYRIRGMEKNHSSQQLKVNILAARDELVHLDTLDLYKARSRTSFIKATASELYVDADVIKRDMGTMLLQLESLQLDRIEAATQSHKPVELSAAEKRSAMKLLKDPKLIDRILEDLDVCGLAGEETNKLVCYLACVSRRLDHPLAILIQSGSSAGKTTLMDAVLSLVPEEEQVRYSAMTGQSLYYMGSGHLKHKILAIAEEEGVAQASYALKLLQSDGKLTIAAAGKNAGSGRQSTETYTVQGPVMMFLTTTSEHPDAELQNRCLTLRVNESSDQTAEIHNRQRASYMQSTARRNPDDIRVATLQRAAVAVFATGRHALGRPADVSPRSNPHAARPCQILVADRFDYVTASTSTQGGPAQSQPEASARD